MEDNKIQSQFDLEKPFHHQAVESAKNLVSLGEQIKQEGLKIYDGDVVFLGDTANNGLRFGFSTNGNLRPYMVMATSTAEHITTISSELKTIFPDDHKIWPAMKSIESAPKDYKILNQEDVAIDYTGDDSDPPQLFLTMFLDGEDIGAQFDTLAAIYAKTNTKDGEVGENLKEQFDKWAAESYKKKLDTLSQKFAQEKEVSTFEKKIEALLNPKRGELSQLSRKVTESESQTPGTKDLMQQVRERSMDNLFRNLQDGHLKNLYYLTKGMIQKGAGDERIPIPGTDIVVTANQLQQDTFWQDHFVPIIENLLIGDSVDLIHNMHSTESVTYNIENGCGSNLKITNTKAVNEDILAPVLAEDPTPKVTFSVPGLRSKLYDKGAMQGGKGAQMRFSTQALADRTIFFPYDTGEPSAMLDINDITFGVRKEKVMDAVHATGLLLVRHANSMMMNYLSNGTMSEDAATSKIGHFDLLEANTIGSIPVNQTTTHEIKIPSDQINYPEGTTKDQIKNKANALGLKVVEV